MQKLMGWLCIFTFGAAGNTVLKLMGLGLVSSWPWWQVLWPLWLPPLAVLCSLLITAVIIGIPMGFMYLQKRWPLESLDAGKEAKGTEIAND